MANHSIVGASSAHRWLECAGSVQLSALAPRGESNVYADMGTAAHSLCEKCLLTDSRPIDFYGEEIPVIKDGQEVARFKVDERMVDSVQVYLDSVESIRRFFCSPTATLEVEQRLTLKPLGVEQDAFGTADLIIRDEASGVLHVIDYKNGSGYVDERNNPQIYYYGLAAYLASPVKPSIVMVHIVQPNAYEGGGRPWRTETVSAEELETKWVELFRTGINKTAEEKPQLVVGEHCFYCPAITICPAVREWVFDTILTLKGAFMPQDLVISKPLQLPEVNTLSNEELAYLNRMSDVVQHFFKAVYTTSLERARAGQNIPEYKLVRGTKHRKWVDEDSAEAVLVSKLGDDAFKKTLITPAQAEKQVGKKIVDQLSEKPEGELKLVHITEKGDPVVFQEEITNAFLAAINTQPQEDAFDLDKLLS